MSYCRSREGISDVYMYGCISGYIDCMSCKLMPEEDMEVDITDTTEGKLLQELFKRVGIEKDKITLPLMPRYWVKFSKRSDAIAHLLKHRKAGHLVPEHAIIRLKQEIKEEGDDFVVENVDLTPEELEALFGDNSKFKAKFFTRKAKWRWELANVSKGPHHVYITFGVPFMKEGSDTIWECVCSLIRLDEFFINVGLLGFSVSVWFSLFKPFKRKKDENDEDS